MAQKYPWKNRAITNLKNRRVKTWKRYRDSGFHPSFEGEYIFATRQYGVLNEKLYNNYMNKKKSKLTPDALKFWQFIYLRQCGANKPKIMRFGELRTVDETEQPFIQQSSVRVSQPTEDSQLDINLELENLEEGTGPDGIYSKGCLSCSCCGLFSVMIFAV